MKLTQHNEVNDILKELMDGHLEIFGDKLVGFYLYGSLMWGDFDISASDIDTMCALEFEVTHDEIELLREMHDKIIIIYPQWKDRIEVQYASVEGLKYFRSQTSKIGVISPGEPLHIVEGGIDWLDAWYLIRQYGKTIYGVDKDDVIPKINQEEFVQTICSYAYGFRERIKGYKDCLGSQAYGILTMCRALYTVKTGEQISKLAAAHWAMDFLPEYRKLIEVALQWRKMKNTCPRDTYDISEKFINDVARRL
ncbi:MAG: DUF4111 domain-containing protein [Defluviitaleaceae bacterium]|nr:DUF4111 domain-containing protein [Defluviitaleaceae bacterium]